MADCKYKLTHQNIEARRQAKRKDAVASSRKTRQHMSRPQRMLAHHAHTRMHTCKG